MQLITHQRLAISAQRENRFPLDALLGMGIYSRPKTASFVAWAEIQFSHRWVNWESICPAVGIYCRRGNLFGKTGELSHLGELERALPAGFMELSKSAVRLTNSSTECLQTGGILRDPAC
ncbi:hypothetical protein Pan181_51070 [Aeoliella mucimassa]|uniref:Uncharacterized protein n=1 Tax=Aeoliella mucimassa TaxID=2527972 RepID=A0A518AVV2_9BACT|nr:hypothetical protein Pan181_51070 [Aeoliella mucimassa]